MQLAPFCRDAALLRRLLEQCKLLQSHPPPLPHPPHHPHTTICAVTNNPENDGCINAVLLV